MKALAFIASILVLVCSGAQADDPLPFTPAPRILPADDGYTPPKPKKGFRYPDCFCTDSQGKRVELGRMTCLQIGSQQFMARCDMSLNNPTWRRVSEGCPSV